MARGIKGVLFDKDGTLFDFRASWAPVYARALTELAEGDPARARRMAEDVGFDLGGLAFARDSILIAGTVAEIALRLARFVPGRGPDGIEACLFAHATGAAHAPVADLPALMAELRRRGLALGLATNDAESVAIANLAAAGLGGMLDFVAGYDSGHGAKPAPGMVLAFCRRTGLDPGTVAMVGDSRHDLEAARSAGARAVAVLTGIATHDELAPHADHVLGSIAELPAWLGPARS
jgi:phosphoglycolate phosphatase